MLYTFFHPTLPSPLMDVSLIECIVLFNPVCLIYSLEIICCSLEFHTHAYGQFTVPANLTPICTSLDWEEEVGVPGENPR